MNRTLRPIVLAALLAATAAGDSTEQFLPKVPEVRAVPQEGEETLFTVRGRDCAISEYLRLMVETGEVAVIVDPLAEMPLTSTYVAVDLHDRRVSYIIDLLGAAAGLDVERELGVFRLMGPPRPGSPRVRTGQRRSAEKFYNMALITQREPEITARAHRGQAELHRRSGDFQSAFVAYETLLSHFPFSKASRDCELLLADCYMEVGDRVRAAHLLRTFLGKQATEPVVRDKALRRLLSLLIEESSFREIEDLREGFEALDVVSPQTLRRLSDAASLMVEAGRPDAAVSLLNQIWLKDPEANAVLGPVLALALVLQKPPDPSSAATILRLSVGCMTDDPDSATALMAYAELAHRADQLPAAILFATSALRCEDSSPAVQLRSNLLLGRIYRGLGLVLRARRHFYEAELLSSKEEAAQLALQSAELALEEGEPERARLLFQESLQHESVRNHAEMGIARALLVAGEPRRARAVLAELSTDEFPVELRESYLLLGVDCLEELGEYENARRLLGGDLAVLASEETQ